MIASIVRWSVTHRGLVLLLALALTVVGARSVRDLPVDAIPDLSDVQVIVKTRYPGQAPQVVEDQVTYPLTTAMLAVPGAVTVRGYSFFSDSFVYVLFEEGTDLYWARSRVLEQLSQVAPTLPTAARPALGPDATGVGWGLQYALIDRSGRHDLTELTTLQDWFLRYDLQTVEGVAEVATLGGMDRQYQVVLDPASLRAHGLTLAAVRRALERGNGEAGGRLVELAEAEYMIRATGYVQGLDDLKAIPLKVTAEGVPVTVGDVAEVRFGPDLRRGIGEFDGEGETVGGVVVVRSGANMQATLARVKARLAELEDSLPEGVELITTYDRSGLIERAVRTLAEKLVEEFLIVALVCAVFLAQLRASLVVAITLPFALLMALLVMRLQGIDANIMSLGGLAIALGAMVDGTVVMLENLHRHRERLGKDASARQRRDAAIAAATEVGPALFFSLLVIALSFAPIFALEAQEGRLFRPLAWTKTWAMVAAALVTITLVPALASLLMGRRTVAVDRNPLNQVLSRGYGVLLGGALRVPWLVLVAALALTVSAWLPWQRLGSEFMPTLREGDLLYMPSAFPAASVSTMGEVLARTNRLIMTVPEVAHAHGKAGRADTATDPAPLTMVETVIRLKPRSEWRPGITEADIIAELEQRVQVPSLVNSWLMPIRNRIDMLSTGVKTPVGVKVSGPDLGSIGEVATAIERVLKAVPGTASVYAERVTGGRYITIDVDRVAAARYGLNVADVHEVVQTAIGGINVSEAIVGRERYGISLRYPRSVRDSLAELEALPVVTASGAEVPLGALGTLRVEGGPGLIRTENARLSGWIYVDVSDPDLGGYVQRAKAALAKEITLPPGHALHWSGQFEQLERARARLTQIVPATLAVIVLLLYLNFRRVTPVLLVLGTLPLALTGGVWLIEQLGYQLSVAVAAGFIALAGVTVELGVLMVLYLEQAAEDAGDSVASLRDAVVQGASRRLRPILMTVAASIAGLLPIMFADGTGSEVTRRIAAPMVGGLISATLLALFVLPVLFFLVHRRRADG